MLHTVRDMIGRTVQVPVQPRRIISLVPSQTELLYDLGLEEEVAGITKFCVHPESWFRSKTRVGGTKQVHADRVAALHPDLIIANKEENVQEQVEALAEQYPVWVSDIGNLEDALVMMRAIGGLTGRQEKAEALARKIEADFRSLPLTSPKKVAYCIWKDPWMFAGGDTFIHDILGRLGWQNVLSGQLRYPSPDLATLAGLQPELVLLSSEPYPFKEKHIAEITAMLPATEVLLVDGEMFSWYGSRLQHAVSYFRQLVL